MAATEQQALALDSGGPRDGSVFINARSRVQTQDGHRVVVVGGVVVAHYVVGDRMAEAHAMVSLVEQGYAKQSELAQAFACSERTVRRHQRRFEEAGLTGLGRTSGYPRGRPRLANTHSKRVNQWKRDGLPNREIARRLGVNEKAVRKLLRRLGWHPQQPEQLGLVAEGADPNVSGMDSRSADAAESPPPGDGGAAVSAAADPNVSGPSKGGTETSGDEAPPVSFDADPGDRQVDRLLAALGLLDDAAPLFRARARR